MLGLKQFQHNTITMKHNLIKPRNSKDKQELHLGSRIELEALGFHDKTLPSAMMVHAKIYLGSLCLKDEEYGFLVDDLSRVWKEMEFEALGA